MGYLDWCVVPEHLLNAVVIVHDDLVDMVAVVDADVGRADVLAAGVNDHFRAVADRDTSTSPGMPPDARLRSLTVIMSCGVCPVDVPADAFDLFMILVGVFADRLDSHCGVV